MIDFLDAARDLTMEKKSFVVVTLVQAKGSTPQDPGAKAIVTKEGLYFGTVGGGKVEFAAIWKAQELLAQNQQKNIFLTWNLQKDLGMSCGGELQFLFELQKTPELQIAIFGAGHISQALTLVLLSLDCRIEVFDPRSEWLEKLPASVKLTKNQIDFSSEKLNNDFYFLVMTQGHATDLPILKKIDQAFPNANYVGVIGSQLKAKKIRAELKDSFASESFIQNLNCPMGLDFGSNQPAEIAISICAQVLQFRDTLKKQKVIKEPEEQVLPNIQFQL